MATKKPTKPKRPPRKRPGFLDKMVTKMTTTLATVYKHTDAAVKEISGGVIRGVASQQIIDRAAEKIGAVLHG